MSSDPDFFSTLLGGQGCSSDGTTSNNPITSFVDGILNSHIPGIRNQTLLSGGDHAQQLELQFNIETHVGVTAELGIGEGPANSVGDSQYVVSGPVDEMDLQNPHMLQVMQQQYMMQMQMQQQMYLQQQQFNLQMQHGGDSSSASSAGTQAAVKSGPTTGDAEMVEEEVFRRYIDELRQGLREEEADSAAVEDTSDDHIDGYDQLFSAADSTGYEFFTTVESNRFREEPEGSAFQTGVELYARGDIAGAIEAFEMELLRDRGNDECWKYLGLCQAENDSDLQAIRCFTHSIENDPFNLDSLLLLGTAYTNELENSKALACIRQWVTHNPDFRGVDSSIQPGLGNDDPYGDGSVLDRTIQLMQAVCEQVESGSSGGRSEVAAQVYSLLGVLYNVSEDYTAAARSFESAIAASPMDYSLHNKLGATLANSNKSKEAIQHYHRAVEIRPRFARAWQNLGIAHANIGEYSAATRAYVKALECAPFARHIFGYLRTTLAAADRMDLLALTYADSASSVGDADIAALHNMLEQL